MPIRICSTMLAIFISIPAAAAATREQHRVHVRVAPVDIGGRESDQMPARVELDFERLLALSRLKGQVNFDSIRVERDSPMPRGEEAAQPIAFRWYDASVPEQFPEFIGALSRTNGELRRRNSPGAGHHFNTVGDGKKGHLAFLHTQHGRGPTQYSIWFELLPEGAINRSSGPRGWLGDGQIRCAETGASTTGGGHTRIVLDDWNDDGLIDIVHGDENGFLFVLPNVGSATEPKFDHRVFIRDADDIPIDIGIHAAPLVIDFDGDGVKDLLIGTYVNRLAWFKNVGSNSERKLVYKGLVQSQGQPLELPIKPVVGRSEAIFDHDYYPVLDAVDWNGNGRVDLLAGGYVTGRIYLIENVGTLPDGTPELIVRDPIEADGQIINVGDWCSAPCVADLNSNGHVELISGLQAMTPQSSKQNLFLRYYEGTGTSPRTFMEKPFPHRGKLPSSGLATPRAADLNADGLIDLVVSARDNIYILMNVGSANDPMFQVPDSPILLPWTASPLPVHQFVDYDGNGRPDLFTTRYQVHFNSGAPTPFKFDRQVSVLPRGVHIAHPTGIGDDWFWPYLTDLTGNGSFDILFGDWHGTIWFHRNLGEDAEEKRFDVDGVRLQTLDGKPIKVGPQETDPQADFAALQGARTVLAAGDVDGDGLLDLVVGDTFGIVRYYRNAGTKESPVFERPMEVTDMKTRGSVDLTDWDGDGRLDIIAGAVNGNVRVFINPGGGGGAGFGEGIDPRIPPVKQPRVMMVDLNGDGDEDLFIPSTLGSVWIERSFLQRGYAVAEVVRFQAHAAPAATID